MSRIAPGAFLLAATLALAACSDAGLDPAKPIPPDGSPHRNEIVYTSVWNMNDLEADFGGMYSIDTTEAGLNATPTVTYDPLTGSAEFCRDHFKPIDLWWNGGYGMMSFHMDPPLLFRGYRTGTFKSNRNLVFRKAIYETVQSSEAVDPAGNVWRFSGRFNALCRGGAFELGPIVFGGQVVVSQDPVDRPVLVQRGGGGGDGGCGLQFQLIYDPYDGSSGDCGGSSGGGDGGGGGGGGNCHVEYIYIEVNYGNGWETWWEGYATVCE